MQWERQDMWHGLAGTACLSLGLLGLCAEADATHLMEPGQVERPAEEVIEFDLVAQPLEAAIDTFSVITGISVVYDASLSAGRFAPSVQGRFQAAEALELLVAKANLRVNRTSGRAYSLVPAPASRPPLAAHLRRPPAHRSYYGLTQHRLLQTLCGNARIAPGSFRLAMQFWVDPSGKIQRVHLLDSTGDEQRDSAIQESLSGLAIAPPPADLAQPFIMVIVPRDQARGADCDQFNTATALKERT